MVGEKGYPLEELIKHKSTVCSLIFLYQIELTVLLLFLLKSYNSFLKYCYADTQKLLSAKLLLQPCRSLF